MLKKIIGGKLNLENILSLFQKSYLWIVGALFFLLVASGGLVYYCYIYKVVRAEIEEPAIEISVNQQMLQEFLYDLEARQENLYRVRASKYFSPFQ